MKTTLITGLLLCTLVSTLSGQNTLNYAFSIGESGTETVGKSISDPSGGHYVYGSFSSSSIDVDPGPSTITCTNAGGEDGILVKYDDVGNYLWSLHLGAGGSQRINDVCLEPNAIDICGFFQDTVDFDPGPGTTNLIGSLTGFTGFVARYTTTGTLIWAQAIGSWSQANGIGVMWNGNIAIVGHFGGSIDSDPGPGTATLTTQGGHDCFYVELSPFTGAFVRSLSWGSNAIDRAYDVSMMGNNIVVCGAFSDTCDFDPGANNSATPAAGNQDGFVLSLDANLQFNWVFTSGSALSEFSCLSLNTWSGMMAAVSQYTLFMLDPSGNTLWSVPLAGSAYINTVSVNNNNGDVIIGGVTGTNTDFDPGPAYALLTGGIKSYWAAYNYANGDYQYVKAIDGGYGVSGVGFTSDNRTTVSGLFADSADYDLSANTYMLYTDSLSSRDIFVAQYSGCTMTNDVQDITLCAGDTLVMGGLHYVSNEFSPGFPQITCIELNQAYGSTETFKWVDVPAQGCDTARTYTVHAMPAYSHQQTLVLCGGDSVVVGPFTHTTSGTYVDVIPSSTGCDSTVTTNLTVNTVDTSLTVSWPTIYSNAVGATYQWIDCSTGNVIAGATSSSYTATANGEYACVVTQNSCTDTSGCYTLNDVSIAENTALQYKVFPLPANNELYIQANQAIESVRILDLSGRVVITQMVNSDAAKVNLSAIASGTYVLEVHTPGNTARQIISKE